MSATEHPKVWFITGTSTGMGRGLTEYVLSRGHIVVATLRTPANLDDLKAKYAEDRLLILRLDVSQQQEITAAFDKDKSVFGRLDIVVNNAGYGMLGEVESTPEDMARTLFDVNFWGAANVSKAAITFFREVNTPGVGGRLINMSSIAGIYPFAPAAYYCASKSALEAFTQALAKEVVPEWNIKISLVEPGMFRTDSTIRSGTILPIHPAYDKPGMSSVETRKFFTPGTEQGDPKKAVVKIYELAELSDPPVRLVLGLDAIGAAKQQIGILTRDINAREDWSKDLKLA